MNRIAFNVSDEAYGILTAKCNGVPANVVVKELLYELLGCEVEPNADTKAKLDRIARRKAELELQEAELSNRTPKLGNLILSDNLQTTAETPVETQPYNPDYEAHQAYPQQP